MSVWIFAVMLSDTWNMILDLSVAEATFWTTFKTLCIEIPFGT